MLKSELQTRFEQVRNLSEKRGDQLIAATLAREALERENDKLRDRVKRVFDCACEAAAAHEKQAPDGARDFLARAKFAANS
jgi:hypothetical protein